MPKSFCKWPGGKKVILKSLVENLPDRSITNYYEPFLGGGALFFHLRTSYLQNADCFLNDINRPLINTYTQIRDNVDEVISYLGSYQCDKELYYEIVDEVISYLGSYQCDKELYYEMRKLFSENKLEESAIQASRFIYLNKCCFNGLYRENKKGFFNSPFGYYDKVNLCDTKTLIEASGALQGVNLSTKSFNVVLEEVIGKNPDTTLIYLDPPYYKEKGNSFTGYTEFGFSIADHVLLRNCVDFLSSYGASVMLSNSDTDFIRELYKDYNVVEVISRRSINRDGNNRKPKKELLIKNF